MKSKNYSLSVGKSLHDEVEEARRALGRRAKEVCSKCGRHSSEFITKKEAAEFVIRKGLDVLIAEKFFEKKGQENGN